MKSIILLSITMVVYVIGGNSNLTVLSDHEVKSLLKEKALIIYPILDESQFCGAKIDLRIDNRFFLIRRIKAAQYDPLGEIEDYLEEYVVPYGDSFILHPGEFVLSLTFEFIRLPDNIVGRLDGRTSLGRLGVTIHSTAGEIDPGFTGPLVLELKNQGMLPVAIYPLMRVATLVLFKIEKTVSKPYQRYGKYGGLESLRSIASKLHKDPEMHVIKNMKSIKEFSSYI